MPDQHASLSEERWAQFAHDQQLLMIANEMHRATKALELGDHRSLSLGYERVLRLADLTAVVARGVNLRRELLRWRGLVGELYLAKVPDLGRHRAVLKVLLGFSPATWEQRQFLLPMA
jgi:hypothetical protein